MAKITPFKAIRPVRDKVHLVATRPIYSYKKNVLESKLEDNPYTFLHIINPEFGGERTTQPNTPERFELVKKEYQAFLEQGILMKEETPRIYIYRQTKNGHVFTGVVAGASNQEYREDKIKKHEATLTSREEMFIDYLDIVGFNAEPVLLSYPHNESIGGKIKEITSNRPEYEFTTTDRVKHDLWVLSENETFDLQLLFEEVEALYIADGHHRSASSVGLEDRRLEEKRNSYANESSFLAFMIDECELQILEFNRVIHSVNGMTEDEFIQKISDSFIVEKCDALHRPEKEHDLIVCIKGSWYKLTCKSHIIEKDHPVNSLDAEILTQYILRPVLNIQDLKTDKNIDFIGGATPVEKIVDWINEGKYELAVFLHPVTIDEVKKVADNQMIMPPKSTWVEPKLRSGMTIYAINE